MASTSTNRLPESSSASNVIATSNPVDTLSSSINANIGTGGQLFLHIYAVGAGDLATGYSDYGSVGVFSIVGLR